MRIERMAKKKNGSIYEKVEWGSGETLKTIDLKKRVWRLSVVTHFEYTSERIRTEDKKEERLQKACKKKCLSIEKKFIGKLRRKNKKNLE